MMSHPEFSLSKSFLMNEDYYNSGDGYLANNNNNNNVMFDISGKTLPPYLSQEPLNGQHYVSSNGKHDLRESGQRKSSITLSSDHLTVQVKPRVTSTKTSLSPSCDGFIQPPPPPTSIRTTDPVKTSKAFKRRFSCISKPTNSCLQSISSRPVPMTSSEKGLTCSSCDLGIVFRNKTYLQHHQSALHTLVSCRYCHLSIAGLVKLRNHYLAVHPQKKSSESTSGISCNFRSQTYHVCGQCDYKTNQSSNLIRHRESLHSYYTCAYCYPESDSFLGKKQLSDHLKKQHRLRINLRTYFEDERKIRGALFVGGSNHPSPQLRCNHCGYATSDVCSWTKHDCKIIKVDHKNSLGEMDLASGSPEMLSSDEEDEEEDDDWTETNPSGSDLFSPSPDLSSFSILDQKAEEETDLAFDDDSSSAVDCVETIPDSNVPNFSAVNEFFEFRLYDFGSSNELNRLWEEAYRSAVKLDSDQLDMVLTRSLHEKLARWEM